MGDSNHLQTALKTLQILRLVTDSGRDMTLSEINAESGLGSTITFRIVKTLVAAGYLEQGDGSKAYRAVTLAGSPSLEKGLKVLRAVADSGARGSLQADLKAAAEIPDVQLDETLMLLGRAGMVQPTPAGRWEIAPGLLSYAGTLLGGDPVLHALRPLMRRLVEETGETLTWFRRNGDEQVVVECIPSTQPISYKLPAGSRYPLYQGAAGMACLADMPDPEFKACLDRLALLADGPDIAALRQRVAAVRKQGFAISRGERVENAAASAVPVRGPDGRSAGVLGVMAPAFRMDEARASQIGSRLLAEIASIFPHTTED